MRRVLNSARRFFLDAVNGQKALFFQAFGAGSAAGDGGSRAIVMLVRESRALFGAIALTTTGAILSSMAHQYFAGEYTGEAIVRSRSWWEVVLNLQVLCLAFMWFCYADRVRSADPGRAFVMRLRMGFGMFSVVVPFNIAVLSVFLNWFEERPSLYAVDLLICFMMGFWLFSTVVPRLVKMKNRNQAFTAENLWLALKPRSIWFTLPAVGGCIILIADGFFGLSDLYFLLPTLFYLQAAMPFLDKAFGLTLDRVPVG